MVFNNLPKKKNEALSPRPPLSRKYCALKLFRIPQQRKLGDFSLVKICRYDSTMMKSIQL